VCSLNGIGGEGVKSACLTPGLHRGADGRGADGRGQAVKGQCCWSELGSAAVGGEGWSLPS